jgi:ribosome-associated protein
MTPVRVSRSLTIPDDEIILRFTPSGGPGGQHANRSATRVELYWNVDESRVLGPRQRQLIKAALRSRIDAGGTLRLTSDARRSQLRNREEVERRLAHLVAGALRRPAQRVATAPTAASRRRRADAKRRRSATKRLRMRPPAEGDG